MPLVFFRHSINQALAALCCVTSEFFGGWFRVKEGCAFLYVFNVCRMAAVVLLCSASTRQQHGLTHDHSLTLDISLHLPVHIYRDGNYGEEYLEVMRGRPLPDLRNYRLST